MSDYIIHRAHEWYGYPNTGMVTCNRCGIKQFIRDFGKPYPRCAIQLASKSSGYKDEYASIKAEHIWNEGFIKAYEE